MKDEQLFNTFGRQRIGDRQVDELIGLARGLCADGVLNQSEVEFLEKWLAANVDVASNPVIGTLYQRVADILADGIADDHERADLLATLDGFTANSFELGEVMKASSLPLCQPPPKFTFSDQIFCFTGTFRYGSRSECEQTVVSRGGVCGSLTLKTNVLVIGSYATESWKHSAFGNKIIRATEMRAAGKPIAIISEDHWVGHL